MELSSLLLLSCAFVVRCSAQGVPMIQPIVYRLPTPPKLTGPLSSNMALTNAEKVHKNNIKGPNSFVNHDGNLYAGTFDNKIYQMAACPPRLIANLSPPGCQGVRACGQLLSLRRDPVTGLLIALDTYRGLFSVNPNTGQFQQIYSSSTPVNGRAPVHLNDMVISPDGLIIMTDSSNVYTFPNDVYICMDGRPTGRLIAIHPKTKALTEILPNTFNFPNGLEWTPDGDLLVTETCRAMVHRVSLKRPTWLQVTPFSVNLPGLPDNIRASGRGTYWIAMSYPRHSGILNPVDMNSGNTEYRVMGFNWMSKEQLKSHFSHWAIGLEINSTGHSVGSVHDPTGNTLRMLTEINEFDGVLNIGSHLVPYMARIILPPSTGSKLSIESYIQLLRSRCQLLDADVAATRKNLLEQQSKSSPLG